MPNISYMQGLIAFTCRQGAAGVIAPGWTGLCWAGPDRAGLRRVTPGCAGLDQTVPGCAGLDRAAPE